MHQTVAAASLRGSSTYLCGCGIGKIPALLKEAGVEDIIRDCLADEGREDLGRIRIVQLDVIGSSEQDVERCMEEIDCGYYYVTSLAIVRAMCRLA
jgi:hypothetical protein